MYYARLSEAAEIRVTEAEQVALLGRPVVGFGIGEPRETAIEWLCRHLSVKVEDDPDPVRAAADGRKRLVVALEVDPEKPWLGAYKALDTAEPVEHERPSGAPLKFIPSATKGDSSCAAASRSPARPRCS